MELKGDRITIESVREAEDVIKYLNKGLEYEVESSRNPGHFSTYFHPKARASEDDENRLIMTVVKGKLDEDISLYPSTTDIVIKGMWAMDNPQSNRYLEVFEGESTAPLTDGLLPKHEL